MPYPYVTMQASGRVSRAKEKRRAVYLGLNIQLTLLACAGSPGLAVKLGQDALSSQLLPTEAQDHLAHPTTLETVLQRSESAATERL